MSVIEVLAAIIVITILLFYFIGSAYVIKKYNGFRIFYNGLNRLFDYKGRAEQIEYACVCLLVTSISLIIGGIFSLLNNLPWFFLAIATFIFEFAILAVTTRRLHDLGYSGWLQAPIVVIGTYLHIYSGEDLSLGGLVILNLVMFGFQIFLMLKRGQEASNKYGEKPTKEYSLHIPKEK